MCKLRKNLNSGSWILRTAAATPEIAIVEVSQCPSGFTSSALMKSTKSAGVLGREVGSMDASMEHTAISSTIARMRIIVEAFDRNIGVG